MPPRPPHAALRAARARVGDALACDESLPLSPPGARRFGSAADASTTSPLSPLVPRDLSKLFESAAVDAAIGTRAARAARRAAMSPLASPRGWSEEEGMQSANRGRGVKREPVPPSTTRTKRVRGVPPPSTGGSRAPSQPRPLTWPPSAGGTTDVSDACDAVPSGASGVLPSFGPPEPRKPAAPPPSALVVRAPARLGAVARPRVRR